MTTEAQQITDLLRDLVASFVDLPASIRVAAQPAADGSCYFAMQGAPEDEPRLVGTAGSHVDAIAFLVARFGAAERREFTFRLITLGAPRDRPKRPKLDVLEHDARPARDLLCRILAALDVAEFSVNVGPGAGARHSLTFLFEIRVKDRESYSELLKLQRVVVAKATPQREERAIVMSVTEALGTLFRAIAMKSGVRYSIAIKEP